MTDYRKPKKPCTIEANRSCKRPPDGGEENTAPTEGAEVEISLRSERFLWSGWHLLPHYFLYQADGSYIIADWYRCPLMHKITRTFGLICDPLRKPSWVDWTMLCDIGENASNDAKTLAFLLFVARNNGLVAEILYRWRLSGELPRHHNEWGPNWRPH